MKQTTRHLAPSRTAAALFMLLATPSASALLFHIPRISPVSPQRLFARDDDACGDSSFVQCSSAGLPSDFCCPADQTCIALAGNTTALCCPSGSDCNEIQPIPCDLSLEDKSQHPDNVVMTTALTGELEACGAKCCPYGYACNAGGNCEMKDDQSAKPSTSAVTSTATATASSSSSSSGSSTSATETAAVTEVPSSSTAGGDASATSSSSASSSTTASDLGGKDSSTTSDASNAGAVAGGIVGGLAGLVVAALLVWWCVRKEVMRKKNTTPNNTAAAAATTTERRTSSSFGNILGSPMMASAKGTSSPPPPPLVRGASISRPVLQNEGAVLRSDFSRKVSPRQPCDDRHRIDEDQHDDDDDDDEAYDYFDTAGRVSPASHIHEVSRSPPRIITTPPRAVSSMYGAYGDNSNNNGGYSPNNIASYYGGGSSSSNNNNNDQPTFKMPSARQFGGSYHHHDAGANVAESGGQQRDPSDAYINVFADSAALSPPPAIGGEPGDRLTSFSDMMDNAGLGPLHKGEEPYLGRRK